MTKEIKSEFGKGLVYNLGLFLAHAERNRLNHISKIINTDFNLWFNASSDHLYELQIPEYFLEDLKNRLKNFQDKCLEWGHGFKIKATEEDITWSIEEAKYLLFMIDNYYKIPASLAEWN